MIAKGFGDQGSCFYLGVVKDSAAAHRFQCKNPGSKLAKPSIQLAFQYTIGNAGKTYTKGTKNDADKNYVVQVAKALSCEMKINTYSSDTSSAVLWYQAKFSTPIDGFGQNSKSGRW